MPASRYPILQTTTDDKSLLNQKVKGYEWNQGINYEKLLATYLVTGFQATNFGLAVQEIKNMMECRKVSIPKSKMYEPESLYGIKNNCTIFMGYTSSIISSGLRETVRFLVQHKMVDCIVATAGGVEEDFMKCFGAHYLGAFGLDGTNLRNMGVQKNANLLVPNDNYCHFENWIMPIFDQMLEEQKDGTLWSPSKIINRLGREINNETSVYYWAAVNNIPVFCPALTDGCLGNNIFMHALSTGGLVIDIASDVKNINLMAVNALNTGIFAVGGGLIKHHICNANSMREGADFSVYINTSCEFDGSEAGAPPDEAKSWGKIKKEATPVKLFAEATLVLPLLVAQTFATDVFGKK